MSKNLPALPPGAKPPALHGRSTIKRLQRSLAVVDQMAERILPFDAESNEAPDKRARPTILIGLTLTALLFFILLVWGALWPLAAGAIAPGRVVVDSSRKDIQHLEGGIVSEVLVKDGDVVKKGSVLVRLDSTSATARNEQLQSQYVAAKATEARLTAERDGAAEITFPQHLLAQKEANPRVRDALDSQSRLFAARKESLDGQISVLNQKIAQSDEEIRGYKEQITSSNSQIKLLNDEIVVVRKLLESGNALKPRLLALERQVADLQGRRGQAAALVARANQTINESKIDIINEKTKFLNDVVKEMKDVQVQVASLEEQLRASADVVRRIELTAPEDGTIANLALHTIGGVVQPGRTLMTLVPSDDKLIIEVRVQPGDIDVVHAGLEAQVHLTAYKNRYMKPMMGKVTRVSADRMDDERTGESYYTARIEISPSEMAKHEKIKLGQGMPAEALILTGRRTMISYLISPIRDSFAHAFRDQ